MQQSVPLAPPSLFTTWFPSHKAAGKCGVQPHRHQNLLRNEDGSKIRIVLFANSAMDVFFFKNVAVVAIVHNASKCLHELTMHVNGGVVNGVAAK